jgi:hypothetical protein
MKLLIYFKALAWVSYLAHQYALLQPAPTNAAPATAFTAHRRIKARPIPVHAGGWHQNKSGFKALAVVE